MPTNNLTDTRRALGSARIALMLIGAFGNITVYATALLRNQKQPISVLDFFLPCRGRK